MAAANAILKMAEQEDALFEAYLPERKKFRKGVITEWEDSIEDLIDFIMPGQGEFEFNRLRKKSFKNGVSEWTEGVAILVTVKGDRLPTEIKIGEGHVGLRVFPYVEPVKQCYNCFEYGHIQKFCKAPKKCLVCLEREHGRCEKTAVCMNCRGNHTSLSKTCWMYQRERAIRKVMAYKNVAYITAKGIVASQIGEDWDNEVIGRDGGSRDFPSFPSLPKRRIEYWESKEVPLNGELEELREAKSKAGVNMRGARRWEREQDGSKSFSTQGRGRGRGRGRLGEEERLRLSGSRGTQSPAIRISNVYEALQTEEEEMNQEEVEYEFGNGLPVERAIKRISNIEQRAQKRMIEQLEKKREEDFLSDLMRLIADKGYEQEVEKLLSDKKSTNQRSEEEEYIYWNVTKHRPDWHVPIPEKTKEKLRRRQERYEKQKEEKEAKEREYEEMATRAHQDFGWTRERANQEEDYRRGRLEELMKRIESRVCDKKIVEYEDEAAGQ